MASTNGSVTYLDTWYDRNEVHGGGVCYNEGNVVVGTELPGKVNNNPRGVRTVLGRTRRVRTSVRAGGTRLRRGRCIISSKNNVVRMAMANGERIGTVNVGPRIISPRSIRVLRSLLVTTLGRTVEGVSRRRRERLSSMANNLGVPKLWFFTTLQLVG